MLKFVKYFNLIIFYNEIIVINNILFFLSIISLTLSFYFHIIVFLNRNCHSAIINMLLFQKVNGIVNMESLFILCYEVDYRNNFIVILIDMNTMMTLNHIYYLFLNYINQCFSQYCHSSDNYYFDTLFHSKF
jgi:hypothetical protein